MNALRIKKDLVRLVLPLGIFCALALVPVWVLRAQELQLNATGSALETRVAPGDLLPVAVELLNFGSNKRVDVQIVYSILTRDGAILAQASQTVAVETTAHFVKDIQVPAAAPPGAYIGKTEIFYEGQTVPATSKFSFEVERKHFGLFDSEWRLYAGITAFVSLLAFCAGLIWIRRQPPRVRAIDYSHIPRDKRIFYEILSDTILQMRQRVGDEAVTIAASIPGMRVDQDTGQVLSMTGSPAKIIAQLVSVYETRLGKKSSFSLRRPTLKG